MANSIIFHPIYLEKNQGHGNARRCALAYCNNELVALMDSDDISYPHRFEIQLKYLEDHPNVDVLGGNITEFIGDERNITGRRYVPETDQEIKTYMKKRCAMNQVSVMCKKTAVDAAGGYLDWFQNEDYYLWIRMLLGNAVFANVPDNIVNVRVGDEMSARRGGRKYFRSEAELQKYMLRYKVIGFPRYLYNVAVRFIAEVMLPAAVRAKLFRFTRKKVAASDVFAGNKLDEGKLRVSAKDYPLFSVAMSVYAKDNAEWFNKALESVVRQTVKPQEIVLVVDGPISDDIQKVIDKYVSLCKGDLDVTFCG